MPTTKKVISAFCATILFLMCTISTACASNTGINPYMDHIALGQCSLDIDGTTAKVNAWVEGRTDVTRTEVTVELQEQYLLFFWKTIDSWSNNSYSSYCRVSASTSVTSGKTYRAVATVTAWAGSDSETQTMTTETTVAG